MQNFVNYLGQTLKKQNALYLPAGDGNVCFVDVRDIAAVAVQILLAIITVNINIKERHTAITRDEPLSYELAAEILSKEIVKRIPLIDIPEEDARIGMKHMGRMIGLLMA